MHVRVNETKNGFELYDPDFGYTWEGQFGGLPLMNLVFIRGSQRLIVPSLGIPSSILFAMNLAQHGVQQPFSFTIIPALCICNIHKWKGHSLISDACDLHTRIASISSDLTSVCAWSCVYMCHPCNWEKRAQLSSWQGKKVAL